MKANQLPSIDYSALGQNLLFKDLSTDALQEICRDAQPAKIDRGYFFFSQGDPADQLYLLLSGQVKLTQVSEDGQQILLRALGPYNLFGLIVLGQAEQYPISAEALEDCAAIRWSKAALIQFMTRYPVLAMNAIQVMTTHTQEFQERLHQMATERVEQRLAHTLLRLATQAGRKIPEGILIDLPLTRQDLGEMTGTTLYTVSRLLTQWENQGLIIADREHIVIRYPHGLASIVER